MTKDEMKNRISFALKDSILQQGFEIICNENAKLKEDYGCLEDAHKVLNELYEKLEKENLVLHEMNAKRLDLQKENAELKEKLKTSLDYNKSLLNALKNSCSTRLNGGLIERAEYFIKEN